MKRLMLGLFLLGACACESKPAAKAPPAAPPKAAATKAAATEPAKPVEAQIPDVEIPVVADYEAAAEKEIDAKNYAAELDAIEASIEADESTP